MCGIALACVARTTAASYTSSSCECESDTANARTEASASAPLSEFLAGLRARGPDHIGTHSVWTADVECHLTFAASLLQLRGFQPRTSPCSSSDGHVLCFNGEVFGGLGVRPGQNDGACLMAALQSATACSDGSAGAAAVPDVLSRIRGPWALLFWEPHRQRLWLGRDVLGRRSLLVHFPDDNDPRLLVTSVSQLPAAATAAAATQQGPPNGDVDDATIAAAAVAAATAGAGAVTTSSSATVAAEGKVAAAVGSVECGISRGASGVGSDGLATSAGSGGVGGAGAGAGGGDEEEGGEPSGTDGYWVELPPGLYSVTFGGSSAGREQGAAASELAAAATETTAAAVAKACCSDEQHHNGADAAAGGPAEVGAAEGTATTTAATAAIFRRFAIGDAVQLVMVRHAWRDPLLLELESYRRAETLETEGKGAAAAGDPQQQQHQQPGPPLARQLEEQLVTGCNGRNEAHLTVVGAAGEVAAAGGALWGPAVEGGAGEQPEEDGLSCWIERPLPATPQDAANALLNVLLAAVRIRCAAINTRSPHPAAAFAQAATAAAAAAAAAQGGPPLPSWRQAADPLCGFTLGAHAGCADADGGATNGVCGSSEATGNSDACLVDSFAGPGWCGGAPRSTNGSSSSSRSGDSGASKQDSLHSAAAPAAAPVMILFSGGADSVLLAALAHRALPPDVPIDLSNVCFAGGTSPDRLAARAALSELSAACPGRRWRLVEVDAELGDVDRHRSRLLALLRPALTVMDFNIGAALWLAVAGQGTLRLPPQSAATPNRLDKLQQDQPEQQPQQQDQDQPVVTPHMHVADATAAAVTTTAATTTITTTSATTMALEEGQFYGSAARVVLLGHGADEQCGGYGRHRTRFRSDGWRGLAGELEVDVRRLWLRNLGRDDRLVADWGREARHPFLDEHVMALLLRMRLDCILDMRLPAGQGDKAVLRRALQLLGLPQAAGRVKRAIQFGSRIGKMSNRRDFGSNRAANKKNAGGVALQDVSRAAAEAAAGAWIKVKAPRRRDN